MGTFRTWFEIGAGSTLGSLTAVNSVLLGEALLTGAIKKAYHDYRVQYFDTVVRADLNDIIVRGMLPKNAYPFPTERTLVEGGNFFRDFYERHKVASITIIGLCVCSGIGEGMKTGSFFQGIYASASVFFALLVFYGIGIGIRNVLRGGQKFLQSTYKSDLDRDGRQYWYIREYIRQALAKNQITQKEAILKISNTRLGQQFPDTIEEIEANVFYYSQRLGL